MELRTAIIPCSFSSIRIQELANKNDATDHEISFDDERYMCTPALPRSTMLFHFRPWDWVRRCSPCSSFDFARRLLRRACGSDSTDMHLEATRESREKPSINGPAMLLTEFCQWQKLLTRIAFIRRLSGQAHNQNENNRQLQPRHDARSTIQVSFSC